MSVHYDATNDNSKIFLFIVGIVVYCCSDNSVLHYSHTLNGNIYSFALDYKAKTIDKIQKINKYLMKKYSLESSSIKHVTVDLKLEEGSD